MLRRTSRSIAWAFTALMLVHAPLWAQDSPSRGLATVLASHCPGDYLRLALPATGHVRGVCQWASPDSLRVHGRWQDQFAVAEVDTVWIRAGNRAREGALIGGTVGAALVTGFLFAVIHGLCDAPGGCTGDYPRAVAMGVGLGGGSGALLGAGLGSLTPGWKRVYPVPEGRRR
jgi:hypothetical protein